MSCGISRVRVSMFLEKLSSMWAISFYLHYIIRSLANERTSRKKTYDCGEDVYYMIMKIMLYAITIIQLICKPPGRQVFSLPFHTNVGKRWAFDAVLSYRRCMHACMHATPTLLVECFWYQMPRFLTPVFAAFNPSILKPWKTLVRFERTPQPSFAYAVHTNTFSDVSILVRLFKNTPAWSTLCVL